MIFGDKMCSGSLHRHNGLNLVDPFSFSALNFLRTYNRLLGPTELAQCYNLTLLKDTRTSVERNGNLTLPPLPPLGTILQTTSPHNSPFRCELNETTTHHPTTVATNFRSQSPNRTAVSSTCPPTPPEQQNSFSSDYHLEQPPTNTFCGNIDASLSPGFSRRQRGEKRPIPDDQKDDKYYERRKRNNEAAKKSRDARKMREDRVAFRAAMLEQENSLLRAQVIALRDEIGTLRQLMCARANSQI